MMTSFFFHSRHSDVQSIRVQQEAALGSHTVRIARRRGHEDSVAFPTLEFLDSIGCGLMPEAFTQPAFLCVVWCDNANVFGASIVDSIGECFSDRHFGQIGVLAGRLVMNYKDDGCIRIHRTGNAGRRRTEFAKGLGSIRLEGDVVVFIDSVVHKPVR